MFPVLTLLLHVFMRYTIVFNGKFRNFLDLTTSNATHIFLYIMLHSFNDTKLFRDIRIYWIRYNFFTYLRLLFSWAIAINDSKHFWLVKILRKKGLFQQFQQRELLLSTFESNKGVLIHHGLEKFLLYILHFISRIANSNSK